MLKLGSERRAILQLLWWVRVGKTSQTVLVVLVGAPHEGGVFAILIDVGQLLVGLEEEKDVFQKSLER